MRDYTFNGICKGTTKAGKPCQRRVVYANGYCKAHGGDSSEFMRARLEQIRQKALRSAARFNRRLRRMRMGLPVTPRTKL